MCVCVLGGQGSIKDNSQSALTLSAHVLASTAVASHSLTQSANQRSERGHLCLPGLPGDEEEAVVGGVDPVGASLADHDSATGASAAAVAAVVLQKTNKNICLQPLSAEAEKQRLTSFKEEETYQEGSSSCSWVLCKSETKTQKSASWF